jgi:hypothetical protein
MDAHSHNISERCIGLKRNCTIKVSPIANIASLIAALSAGYPTQRPGAVNWQRFLF